MGQLGEGDKTVLWEKSIIWGVGVGGGVQLVFVCGQLLFGWWWKGRRQGGKGGGVGGRFLVLLWV